MSQRLDQLKREDPIIEQDLIKVFRDNMSLVKTNLGINSYEPLLQFLPSGSDQFDQAMKTQFTLLI